MKSLISELGLNKDELERRYSLLNFSQQDYDLLVKCIDYIPDVKSFSSIIKQTLNETPSTSVDSLNFKTKLQQEIHRYMNTFMKAEEDYLYCRVELCMALAQLNVHLSDFLLRMHSFHQTLSDHLRIKLKKDNLSPHQTLAALQKFIALDNQLLNEINQALQARDIRTDMQKFSFKDQLTNTYNLWAFTEELDRAVAIAERSKKAFTLLHVDFDELKKINQKFGYEAGDKLLQQFAEICIEQLRKTETIARDDDEFFILLPNTPIENIRPVCERIVSKFEAVAQYPINIRVGGYSFQSDLAMTPEILLARLEAQLEYAKERSIITDSHEFNLSGSEERNNVVRLIK
ncbi:MULTISPECIES: GGDEF domain-containing protein [Vibrio]|uniref:GGDEF domain-containing protein n=1 Tax=Vibrio TaxID=662 RepID=UPI00142EFE4D|nr:MULTISPECIES: GGDEF domain-containing protein [Vibrio]